MKNKYIVLFLGIFLLAVLLTTTVSATGTAIIDEDENLLNRNNYKVVNLSNYNLNPQYDLFGNAGLPLSLNIFGGNNE